MQNGDLSHFVQADAIMKDSHLGKKQAWEIYRQRCYRKATEKEKLLFVCKLTSAAAEPGCDGYRMGQKWWGRDRSQGAEIPTNTFPQPRVLPHTLLEELYSAGKKQVRREKIPYRVQPNVH